jgi:hypothetical protein
MMAICDPERLSALLVLSESATMIHFLSRYFLLEDSLIDTFDGTLVACGHDALIADGRQLRGGSDRGHDHIALDVCPH